ncbi:MAG: hypothetical protein A2506_08005 [Elusimicrobia bacterium RIFOXYD12_FULL_66_9]|nr:MAG: hypothetical protein A2506_08005 [Elusimicrobia bacterium RIFOXYD12_FULL_66_9]
MSLKETIKSLPLLGPLALKAFRFVYHRLPTSYPGSPRAAVEVMRQLSLAVEYAYGAEVEGDVAEFGVMSGRTALTLAAAMREMEAYGRPPRRLHLFDSFEGLPEPTAAADRDSVHVRSAAWSAGACKVVTPERLETMFRGRAPGGGLSVWEGWFKDTVANLPPEARFALLHLDCDLYESTLDALEPLFASGRISQGAILLFDDWNCNRADPRFGQQRAWTELCARHAVRSSDQGAYAVFGRRLIVHDYARKPL